MTPRSPVSFRTTTIACGVLLAVVTAGCGSDDDGSDAAPDTSSASIFPLVVDDCGREVVLDGRPESVMTVGASALGLMHSAGAVEFVAARSGEYGTTISGPVGDAVAAVPVIDEGDPTAEVIVGQDPDLVIGYGLYETTPEDLAASGIPSLLTTASCAVLNPDAAGPELADIYSDIEFYGQLFDTEDAATQAVTELRGRTAAAIEQVVDSPFETAAALYIDEGGLGAHGSRHLMHDVIGQLGMENTFGDLEAGYAEPAVEELLDRDPDIIVVTYGWFGDETFEAAEAALLALPGASDLTAVREGRVFGLHYSEAEPQPEAITGVEGLAGWIADLS